MVYVLGFSIYNLVGSKIDGVLLIEEISINNLGTKFRSRNLSLYRMCFRTDMVNSNYTKIILINLRVLKSQQKTYYIYYYPNLFTNLVSINQK